MNTHNEFFFFFIHQYIIPCCSNNNNNNNFLPSSSFFFQNVEGKESSGRRGISEARGSKKRLRDVLELTHSQADFFAPVTPTVVEDSAIWTNSMPLWLLLMKLNSRRVTSLTTLEETKGPEPANIKSCGQARSRLTQLWE